MGQGVQVQRKLLARVFAYIPRVPYHVTMYDICTIEYSMLRITTIIESVISSPGGDD